MLGNARGIFPAGKRLLPLILLMAASVPRSPPAPTTAWSMSAPCRASKARWKRLPAPSRTACAIGVPTVVAITTDATRKLLAANGWVPYLRPLDEKSAALIFKKAQQGLYVSFTQGLGRPDQSVVYYSSERINANVPFPPAATDIVFDENRPYLGCIAPAALEVTLDFFRKELAAIGWQPLTAADAAGHWPNATLNETIENGVRAYYTHDDGEEFLPAEADHADAAAPARWHDRRRYPGRAICAAANAGSRFRDGRPAAAEVGQRLERRPAAPTRIAARSKSPRWRNWRPCWPSIAANSARVTGRKRRPAPSSPPDHVTLNFSSAGPDRNAATQPQIRPDPRQSRHAGEGSRRWRHARRQRKRPTIISSRTPKPPQNR